MSGLKVRLEWLTGIKTDIFSNVRLVGSWSETGAYQSTPWLRQAMEFFVSEDGCPAWFATITLDKSFRGWWFHWGVFVDGPQSPNMWGIPVELDNAPQIRYRSFYLDRDGQVETYRLTDARLFGANKVSLPGDQTPRIQFACRAPHAHTISLVTGTLKSGYIDVNGGGVVNQYSMARDNQGIWRTDVQAKAFADFARWDHTPYMFKITREGSGDLATFRTDLYSRCQIGSGRKDPARPGTNEKPWDGTRSDLKGSKSCSVVIDPERVTEFLTEGNFPERHWLCVETFWANEFDHLRPVPNRVEDLIIYEMHIEGLWTGTSRPATFQHAIDFLDHLVSLGINAVELLPAAEAEAWSWGYGTSHHFAAEYAGGGRDQFKHFVRACHQRGIAVLLDVVYNHWIHDGERCSDLFDSVHDEHNFYYWYEGTEQQWPIDDASERRTGGYLDNGSSGWLPNLRDEQVRRLFASSAAIWLTEFHVDGFRVDLTQALHRDNVRHGDGVGVPAANAAGGRFLREWVRTLRLLKPNVMLFAEDHSGWSALTEDSDSGGIGFDAIWWAEWYHNLIGDSQNSVDNARILFVAGQGGDEPLAMTKIAETLRRTERRVVYHESHDQAGNAKYDAGKSSSARTIQVAVNNRLTDESWVWAIARTKVVAGLTLLTPGIPMFFMGEEVGAREPYRYDDWLSHRENFKLLGATTGAGLLAFYRDVIALRRCCAAIRSPLIEILHCHDANRVLVYRTWLDRDELIVALSLSNAGFDNGYIVEHPTLDDRDWYEALNSNDVRYGGAGKTSPETLRSSGHRIELRLPANSLIVFRAVAP